MLQQFIYSHNKVINFFYTPLISSILILKINKKNNYLYVDTKRLAMIDMLATFLILIL